MLSVIIPVGGGRLANLHLVLTSLDCQQYKDFEVIVVNDGSHKEDTWGVCQLHPNLDLTYLFMPKHIPGTGTTQPRNRGARAALREFYIFADSDVLLREDALAWYVEDFTENPNRVICGLYEWLHPMRVTPRDVLYRFDAILEEQLPKSDIPQPQTHMVNRDARTQMFHEQDPSFVFRPLTMYEWAARGVKVGEIEIIETARLEPTDQAILPPAPRLEQLYQQYVASWRRQIYPKYLGMWSGNIGWPAKFFWEIGGYWDELAAGAHEDGCSGLAACMAGLGLSFDYRIRGGHLYHSRDIARIQALWKKEIPMLNARFHLEDYADGEGPRDSLPSLQTMSKVALEQMGVAQWKRKGVGADEESGFRGI